MIKELVIEQLQFGIEDREIVSVQNITLKSGEWLTIFGPNGAGKSSLIKALINIIPGKVRISIDGSTTTALNPVDYYYIPQQLPRGRGMDFKSLLSYSLYARSKSFDALNQQQLETVQSIVEKLKLKMDLDRDLQTLSGGELQKCFLAAAIFSQASILLLDEPTANLDPAVYKLLLQTLSDLKKQGRIIISVSHHFDGFIANSDYLLGIKNGEQQFLTKPQNLANGWEELLYE